MLQHKIVHFIEENRLFSRDDKVLVALSGGADSVALLCILHDSGYLVEAAHCNFHLRGDESQRDERFCEELCRDRNIPFHRAEFPTQAYARRHGISIEMAARTLRYAFFEQKRLDIGAAVVAVAHHQEDSVETILLNLIRGTGIRGLQGIKPQNGKVVRPLIGVSRSEIISYLDEIKQDYVTDSSNSDDVFQRNFIRLRVLPLLASVNPQAMANISRMADHVKDVVRLLDYTLEQEAVCCVRDGAVVIGELKKLPAPKLFLFAFLQQRAFSPAQVEQIYGSIDSQTGRHWFSSTHEALLDRGLLRLAELPAPGDSGQQPLLLGLPESGRVESVALDDGSRLSLSLIDGRSVSNPSRSPRHVMMDADKVMFPLHLRPARLGDRIRLPKLSGSKLVSDELCDRHVSLFDRRRQLVLADGSGQVIWLVGIRLSAHVYITPDTTTVLDVEIR